MKALRVEFVAPQAWRFVWGFAGLSITVVLGCVAWQAALMSREHTILLDQAEAIQNQLSVWTHTKPATATPKDLSNGKAMSHLQFDLNKVFAVIENVDVSGTRLTGFNVDAGVDVLRIEYSMELATKASEITEALNAGYENRPWRLDRITSTPTPAYTGAFQAGSTPMSVGGMWSAKSSSL